MSGPLAQPPGPSQLLPKSVQEICAGLRCSLRGLDLYVDDAGCPLPGVSPAAIGAYVGNKLAYSVCEDVDSHESRLPMRCTIIDLITVVALTTEHYARLVQGAHDVTA